MKAFLYARISIIEKASKAPRTQLHVPNCVTHVTVPKIGLNQAQIRTSICEIVAARVAKGVRVDVERVQSSPFSESVKHKLHRPRCHRTAALRDENEIAGPRAFSLKTAQGSNFHPTQAMVAGYAPLGAPDVENPFPQVKLVPAGLQTLLDAQSVREENKDQGRIAQAMAVLSGHLDQPIYLSRQEVLPLSGSANGHCSLYSNRDRVFHVRNPQYFHRVPLAHCSQKAQKENS